MTLSRRKTPIAAAAAVLSVLASGTARGDGATAPMQHQRAPVAAQTLPTLPGQDAFGAIQEIVRLLEADPATDWTKVNLEALRQHLVDMNELTLRAAAAPREIEGGLDIAVTGTGRTREAIRRMVAAHAREIDGYKGWTARTSSLPDGMRFTVTAVDPKEVAHIRGLGFIGIMASGASHPAHHMMMAKGLMHMH
jgi:hypothetical protein